MDRVTEAHQVPSLSIQGSATLGGQRAVFMQPGYANLGPHLDPVSSDYPNWGLHVVKMSTAVPTHLYILKK